MGIFISITNALFWDLRVGCGQMKLLKLAGSCHSLPIPHSPGSTQPAAVRCASCRSVRCSARAQQQLLDLIKWVLDCLQNLWLFAVHYSNTALFLPHPICAFSTPLKMCILPLPLSGELWIPVSKLEGGYPISYISFFLLAASCYQVKLFLLKLLLAHLFSSVCMQWQLGVYEAIMGW